MSESNIKLSFTVRKDSDGYSFVADALTVMEGLSNDDLEALFDACGAVLDAREDVDDIIEDDDATDEDEDYKDIVCPGCKNTVCSPPFKRMKKEE